MGAYAAREAAVRAIQKGAKECLVRLAYAPNCPMPLDVCYEMIGSGERQTTDFFNHSDTMLRYASTNISATLAQGHHFIDRQLPWNVAS
jgi:hypothetical protein